MNFLQKRQGKTYLFIKKTSKTENARNSTNDRNVKNVHQAVFQMCFNEYNLLWII